MKSREWLVAEREKYNLSQTQLANKIGISKFAIQSIEQGRRNGSDEVWKKIEEFFELEEKIKNGTISRDSLCRIKINEAQTTRGFNNLFYQVEIYDEDGRLINVISYQRNCVANMLHETPIFDFFRRNNDQFINRIQCEEYCNKLESVIKMLDKIYKIY